MSESALPKDDGGSFKTINCVDVWFDAVNEPSDRPLPPAVLEYLRKERTKIYGSPDPGTGQITPEVEAALERCVDAWFDAEGDTTVRPVDPSRLEHIKAEREKIRRWSQSGSQPPPTPPANGETT